MNEKSSYNKTSKSINKESTFKCFYLKCIISNYIIKPFKFFIVTIFILLHSIHSQNIYENPRGIGIIDIFDSTANIVVINSLDKKIELNYGKYYTIKNVFFPAVLELGGKAKNSTSSIVNTGDVVPEAKIKFKFGYRLDSPKINNYNPTKTNESLWFITDIGFTVSKFNLFDPDTLFEQQILTKLFTGCEINVGLNYWISRLYGMRFIGAVAIGLRMDNNLNELTEKSLEDSEQIQDPQGEKYRIIRKSKTVFQGKYIESTSWPITVSLVAAPNFAKNIAFNFYFHASPNPAKAPDASIGIGMYFLKNNNPLHPIGGVSINLTNFAINLLLKIDIKSI